MSCSSRKLSCVNPSCSLHGMTAGENIVRHGYFRTKMGQRRRWRCSLCGRSFSSNTKMPYYRIQSSRSAFDLVASMSVEGVSRSSIARLMSLSWNTVDRWLQHAAAAARDFTNENLQSFELIELQLDEIQTFVGSKDNVKWLFASIEVSSRLWPSMVIGRRSYKNTEWLIGDVLKRSWFRGIPLITSDGFKYYGRVIRRLFRHACIYGQVQKTWRCNRVIKVERKPMIGSRGRLEDALLRSEDSETLNTSFIERLNLTLRQCSASLARRTLAHARCPERLIDQVELLRCWYNFCRPHRGLKFGKKLRTPAVQAGLTSRALTFRDVFTAEVRRAVGCHARVLAFPAKKMKFDLKLAA